MTHDVLTGIRNYVADLNRAHEILVQLLRSESLALHFTKYDGKRAYRIPPLWTVTPDTRVAVSRQNSSYFVSISIVVVHDDRGNRNCRTTFRMTLKKGNVFCQELFRADCERHIANESGRIEKLNAELVIFERLLPHAVAMRETWLEFNSELDAIHDSALRTLDSARHGAL